VLTGIQQASIGACPHPGGWDATTAASGQSVLSGVLAGFVFGGIVVVLSTREGRRGRETARALKLLFSAFFGLVVTAYLFADQAADTNCVRAFAEENLAGALLGTFALVLIVSLTWLVVAYRLHAEGALGFFRSLIYFASAFVVMLLCTSSYSYLQYVLPHGPPRFTFPAMYGTGVLGFVIAIPPGSWAGAARRLRNRIAPPPGRTTAEIRAVSARDTAVEWCARGALGFLAFGAIADAVVLATPDDWWSRPHPVLHYANAWSSLVLPLVILVLALRAIAPDHDADAEASQDTAGASAGQPSVPAAPDSNPGDVGNGRHHQMCRQGRKQPTSATDFDHPNAAYQRSCRLSNKQALNDIRARQDSAGISGHYLSLSVTVVSLGLAAAAAAAANLIAQHPSPGWNFSILWLLWVGGVLGIVVGYGGPMVGAFALPPAIPLIQDLIPPLVLGISEFLVFGAFLGSFTSTSNISSALTIWFAATCIYGISAFVIVLRARFLYAKSRNKYDDEVIPALNSYIAYMTISLSGPVVLVVLAVLGELSWWVFNSKLVVSIFLALIIAHFGLALKFHNIEARPWEAVLEGRKEPEAPQIIRRSTDAIRGRVEIGELDGRYFLPAKRLRQFRTRLFRDYADDEPCTAPANPQPTRE